MSRTLKSPPQEEFSVMTEKMHELGFRAADVARALGVTHGAVSQYLSGLTNPSETVLSLFRRVLVERRSEAASEAGSNDKRVKEQLEDLRKLSPGDYDVIKTTISVMHKKLPTAFSSKAGAAAKRMLKKGAVSVQKRGPKSRR